MQGWVEVLTKINLNNRGGVEDTRLEAKAKDTKKNPRPRTGMLEAKNQGHKCKCFPKKKDLKNFFSVDLKKKTV